MSNHSTALRCSVTPELAASVEAKAESELLSTSAFMRRVLAQAVREVKPSRAYTDAKEN